MTVAVGTALAEEAQKPGPRLPNGGKSTRCLEVLPEGHHGPRQVLPVPGINLETAYRRSIYCGNTIEQRDGKMTSRYCGARWCLVCSSIRTARLWEAHKPIIDGWRRPFFVTLTVRNPNAVRLRSTLDEMLARLKRVKQAMEYRGVPLVALRKIECTYNAKADTYHPHFHLVVKSRAMAELLIRLWLEQCGDDATPEAQDQRPAAKSVMAELLKYFTKMIAKSKFTDPAALDVIFCAMKSRRVYQSIGYTLPDDDDDDEEIELDESTTAVTRHGESITWEWSQRLHDWIDYTTGDCLTGYEPVSRFRAFVGGIA